MGQQTEQTANQSARRLKVLYICALSAIALLTITSQVKIQGALSDQLSSARTINKSGYMRMLSQRATKAALLATQSEGDQQKKYCQESIQAIAQLERLHRGLLGGDDELNLTRIDDDDKSARRQMGRLTSHIETFALLADEIEAEGVSDETLASLLKTEAAFLPRMDALVDHFESRQDAWLAGMRFTEYTLLGITLLLLLIEAVLIFEPAVRVIRSQFRDLLTRESELRNARDAAELANRTKTEFLANMSHEIRTPMTAILGYAETLLEERLDPIQRQDASKTIMRNGRHLLSVLNDILDIARLEAGKLTVERVPVQPQELFAEIMSAMRPRAAEKRIQLECSYPTPIPAQIHTDPTRLRQILMNLVGNAIKFTDAGRVDVRISCSTSEQPQLIVEVEDTGIGMSPEQSTRIFEPFEQADTTVTRRFGGTGLGLSISRRLAEKLGGDITVTSRQGSGSIFRLTLETGSLRTTSLVEPTRESESYREPSTPTPKTAHFHGRVLLAEDGVDNQKLITHILSQAGIEVTHVENGADAVDAALHAADEGAIYDLILMDMQMPVMDGYAATSKLRESGYNGPIVALTAHAMTGDRERCLRAGCDDYTTKPIRRETLFGKLAQFLETAETTAS